ncbi:hypothetical protein D3C83_19630 [compost metagenome]
MCVPTGQASTSASSMIVALATSAVASSMFWAMTRRTPRINSTGPISERIFAARCTSAAVISPSEPVGVTMARSTLSLRASTRTAGVTLMPADTGGGAAGASGAVFWPTSTLPTTVPASGASLSPSNATSGAPICAMSPGLP